MTELDALQAALATEHEVVYGYGVVGAQITGAQITGDSRRYAVASLDAHLTRRDQLAQLIGRQGATPTPAAPAYVVPKLRGEQDAASLAARLEDASAGAAWDVVVVSTGGDAARRLAVSWLTDAAIRAAHWRGTREADPALPGRPS
jgi:hypothetical protein